MSATHVVSSEKSGIIFQREERNVSDSERVDVREEEAGIQDRALKTGMSPFFYF